MANGPIHLNKHRAMTAQKATGIRCVSEVEANSKALRDKQAVLETELLATPAASWPEAAAKARYVLNLYAASLAPSDTHRDLVAAVVADFARLSAEK
jgi:hypothetical protein